MDDNWLALKYRIESNRQGTDGAFCYPDKEEFWIWYCGQWRKLKNGSFLCMKLVNHVMLSSPDCNFPDCHGKMIYVDKSELLAGNAIPEWKYEDAKAKTTIFYNAAPIEEYLKLKEFGEF